MLVSDLKQLIKDFKDHEHVGVVCYVKNEIYMEDLVTYQVNGGLVLISESFSDFLDQKGGENEEN